MVNTYLQQLVSDCAVAAADTQVACNAIVRFASNIGSIKSMVSAADFDSTIEQKINDVYHRMNSTAYHAERASQLGMEASACCSSIVLNYELEEADEKIMLLVNAIQLTNNELVHVKEFFQQFAGLIMRIKIKNQLVSDELISLVDTAQNDANNANVLLEKAVKSVEAVVTAVKKVKDNPSEI